MPYYQLSRLETGFVAGDDVFDRLDSIWEATADTYDHKNWTVEWSWPVHESFEYEVPDGVTWYYFEVIYCLLSMVSSSAELFGLEAGCGGCGVPVRLDSIWEATAGTVRLQQLNRGIV